MALAAVGRNVLSSNGSALFWLWLKGDVTRIERHRAITLAATV